MDRGRVGEDRGSKEADGCPLTLLSLLPPLLPLLPLASSTYNSLLGSVFSSDGRNKGV
jgi:hypothetical protein